MGLSMACFSLLAQEPDAPPLPSEIEVRLGLATSFWLHKDWNAKLEMQLRTDGNGTRYSEVFAEGQLEYELSKHGRLAGEYRFGVERYDGLQQRVALNTSTRFWKSGDWELDGRTQLQCGWSWEDPAEADWRNRLRMSWKLNKRWDFEAAAELWSACWPAWSSADRTRLGLEAAWDRGSHDIAFGYAFDLSLGMREPEVQHILALRYRFGSIRIPLFEGRGTPSPGALPQPNKTEAP